MLHGVALRTCTLVSIEQEIQVVGQCPLGTHGVALLLFMSWCLQRISGYKCWVLRLVVVASVALDRKNWVGWNSSPAGLYCQTVNHQQPKQGQGDFLIIMEACLWRGRLSTG